MHDIIQNAPEILLGLVLNRPSTNEPKRGGDSQPVCSVEPFQIANGCGSAQVKSADIEGVAVNEEHPHRAILSRFSGWEAGPRRAIPFGNIRWAEGRLASAGVNVSSVVLCQGVRRANQPVAEIRPCTAGPPGNIARADAAGGLKIAADQELTTSNQQRVDCPIVAGHTS